MSLSDSLKQMTDLMKGQIEFNDRICYVCKHWPNVDYTISDDGRVIFTHDDDAVHYLLSHGGKAR
jgi:hypothetical protein